MIFVKKVVIVEGKHDLSRLKQVFPNLSVLITNGGAVSDEFLELVRSLSEKNEVVLLLDPDYSGERIRKTISSYCPNVSHAFVRVKDAISKNGKKIGVEHVDLEILKNVLNNVSKADYHENVTVQDLYDLGLVGNKESKKKRKLLCERLNIGYVNGKQLAQRLNLFNITLKQVKEVL